MLARGKSQVVRAPVRIVDFRFLKEKSLLKEMNPRVRSDSGGSWRLKRYRMSV
jgi:hypothetical protein